MPLRASHPWFAVLALGGAVVAPACSSYGGDATVSLAMPLRENFGVVSSILEPHCGTLDCHGGPGRNFRVAGLGVSSVSMNMILTCSADDGIPDRGGPVTCRYIGRIGPNDKRAGRAMRL